MTTRMSKRERVDAALQGAAIDRFPVSAWQHFIPEETHMDTLAAISLHNFHEYDWDWLKVNPRASCYAEAWGNQYDFTRYTGVHPHLVSAAVSEASNLAALQPVSPTEGVFGNHLTLLQTIKAGIGDAHFIQTVFSPLSVLSYLFVQANLPPDASREERIAPLRRLLHEYPEHVHAALKAITETLAGYAAASVDAGASGLFFAIVRLAREDALTREEYQTFGRPYDMQVLAAIQGTPFSMLHLCGTRAYFDLVADYPVQAINWAAVGQENPSLAEGQARTQMAVVGGVDEVGVLQNGTPEEVVSAAHAALIATTGQRVLLAPGCTTAMDVPSANLHALRRAAEV